MAVGHETSCELSWARGGKEIGRANGWAAARVSISGANHRTHVCAPHSREEASSSQTCLHGHPGTLSAGFINPSILLWLLDTSPDVGYSVFLCELTFVDLGIGEVGHWVCSEGKREKEKK